MERPNKDQIEKFINEMINPGLEMHGGYAQIQGYDESTGVLGIMMGGGCQGCANATATLKLMITHAIQEEFPGISEVVDVTDHAQGQNPYY